MSINEKSWGLSGIGSHANITAELDEPLDGKGPWQLSLSGETWDFRIAVTGIEDIRALSDFVTKHTNKAVFANHRVGAFCTNEVVIVKDSEFEDRFFLRIIDKVSMAEVTIKGENADSLKRALEHLVLDLAQ